MFCYCTEAEAYCANQYVYTICVQRLALFHCVLSGLLIDVLSLPFTVPSGFSLKFSSAAN